MRVVRHLPAIVALSLAATVPATAHAEPSPTTVAPKAANPPAKPPPKPAPKVDPGPDGPHPRGGLVIGLANGFATGTASGYPNDLQKIDDPRYYSAGGFMVGQAGGGFVMGAFARQLNFGIWMAQGNVWSASNRWRSRGGGAGFRVEVFPFGWFMPKLRDLGVMGQFGVGSGDLKPTDTTSTWPGAEGVQSYLAVGVFQEFVFAHPGKTRWVVGPSIEYQLVSSRPFERSTLMIGVRAAFYSGN